MVTAVLPAKELPLRFSGDTAKCFLPSLFYQAQASVHSVPVGNAVNAHGK